MFQGYTVCTLLMIYNLTYSQISARPFRGQKPLWKILLGCWVDFTPIKTRDIIKWNTQREKHRRYTAKYPNSLSHVVVLTVVLQNTCIVWTFLRKLDSEIAKKHNPVPIDRIKTYLKRLRIDCESPSKEQQQQQNSCLQHHIFESLSILLSCCRFVDIFLSILQARRFSVWRMSYTKMKYFQTAFPHSVPQRIDLCSC